MKAVVIHNPAAGAAPRRQPHFEQALDVLREARWNVTVSKTSSEGHAEDLARDAVRERADIVIAAGGDGTVNEVLQGLVHTSSALGVLPMGTANVWAKEAGFSNRIVRAAQQLIAGTRVAIDVGRVGDRFFLLMAGVGLDAEVTAALGDAKVHKQKVGVLPYILRLATVVPRYRGARVEIELDDHVHARQALMVLISNTRLYGGVRRPIRHAVADDGLLDIRVFPGRELKDTVKHLIGFLWERQEPVDSNNLFRSDRIVLRSEPPAAVQIDGDPVGVTPIEIAIEGRALNVILSPSYDRDLLGREST